LDSQLDYVKPSVYRLGGGSQPAGGIERS
jgi:hypothetical protein